MKRSVIADGEHVDEQPGASMRGDSGKRLASISTVRMLARSWRSWSVRSTAIQLSLRPPDAF